MISFYIPAVVKNLDFGILVKANDFERSFSLSLIPQLPVIDSERKVPAR